MVDLSILNSYPYHFRFWVAGRDFEGREEEGSLSHRESHPTLSRPAVYPAVYPAVIDLIIR
jgi:hypothetical protein